MSTPVDEEPRSFRKRTTILDAATTVFLRNGYVGTSMDEIAAALRALSRRQLEQVMQPRLMQLRRLVIGEANRFPQLGRAFYEHGAGRSGAALAAAFELLTARGLLRAEDPELAAAHFNWL